MTGPASSGERIVITVTPDGLVSAETQGVLGERCLDYVAILEDLIEGQAVSSEYTADYTRTNANVEDYQEDHGVEHA